MHQPSPETLFHFDDNLRKAFEQETKLFFESIMRENRSVARSARCRLHVPERAAGEALRHSRRARRALPARDAAGRTARAAGCSGRARF